jgi:uncharacterized protein (TIGR04222 family)
MHPLFDVLFLLVYLLFAVLCLGISSEMIFRLFNRTSYSSMPEIPDPPDPYEYLFLKGGRRVPLLQTAVFRLIQLEHLHLEGNMIKRTELVPYLEDLAPIEQNAYLRFSEPRRAENVFRTGFWFPWEKVSSSLTRYHQRAQQLGLCFPSLRGRGIWHLWLVLLLWMVTMFLIVVPVLLRHIFLPSDITMVKVLRLILVEELSGDDLHTLLIVTPFLCVIFFVGFLSLYIYAMIEGSSHRSLNRRGKAYLERYHQAMVQYVSDTTLSQPSNLAFTLKVALSGISSLSQSHFDNLSVFG